MPAGLTRQEAEATWAGIDLDPNRPDLTLKPTVVAGKTIELQATGSDDVEAIENIASYLKLETQVIMWPDSPGTAAAHYEILEQIGEGGMGIVYRAKQTSANRTIALKLIKETYAHNLDQRNTFLAEAMVMANLEHPNIVPVHDVGTQDNGIVFYAMKEVRGTPWSLSLKHIRLDENLGILMRIADAVSFAHKNGVIHRDLKPDNILLGNCGEVMLTDWGLAASVEPGAIAGKLDDSFSLAGTPAYMSPEMALGDCDRISTQSDVYLLGAILFEIVTGKRPHTGLDTLGCIVSASNNEIQSTEASGELIEVAMKAMATRPEDRYVDAREFHNAVLEYRSHSESIALSEQAKADLAHADKTGDYERFDQAIFGFRQALRMWPDNTDAEASLRYSRLSYATRAFHNGDLDVALLRLDYDDPTHADLLNQVLRAGMIREGYKRKTILLGIGLAVVAIVLSILACVWLRG